MIYTLEASEATYYLVIVVCYYKKLVPGRVEARGHVITSQVKAVI